jgi:hypothetical protein
MLGMLSKTKSFFSIMRHSGFSWHTGLARYLGFASGLSLCLLVQESSTVWAGTDASLPPGVPAYCDYVLGSATSSIAQQLYPRLYLSGGLLTRADSVNDAGTAGTGTGTLWRLQAGVSYSLADLNEGLAIRDRARAECTLYHNQSNLFAFLARYDEADSIPGLQAKINTLEEALPTAERILEEMRGLLLRQQATLEEVNATSLRVGSLRSELGSSRARVAAAARKHSVPREPVTVLMQSYQKAVGQTAESESRVRLSRRYDLSLRAGYDRLFGVRDGIPLLATLTFTYSLGSLAQPRAEALAQQGRTGWATLGVEGIHDRVAVLLAKLQGVLQEQSQRGRETSVLLADLETRYKAVEKAPGDSVRAYRDYLWFDLIRLRAEDAYLRAQTEELRALLPPSGD